MTKRKLHKPDLKAGVCLLRLFFVMSCSALRHFRSRISSLTPGPIFPHHLIPEQVSCRPART